MPRYGYVLLAPLCLSVVFPTGCRVAEPGPSGFSVRHFAPQDGGVALDFAETALRAAGFRIDARDRAGGTITAVRKEVSDGASRTRRVGRRPSRRLSARVRVVSSDTGLKVFCRVFLQELATEAHRLAARDFAGRDTPVDTPIDREAATTARQNTVWRTLHRDRAVERLILSRIAEASEAGF